MLNILFDVFCVSSGTYCGDDDEVKWTSDVIQNNAKMDCSFIPEIADSAMHG